MSNEKIEHLPYDGQSPQDALAFRQYLDDVKRGKALSQLQAVVHHLTDEVKNSWSPRSFTPVITPVGYFDAVTCNISYHFHKHGSGFGSVANMTQEAKKYFQQYRNQAVTTGGLLRFPNGSLFEVDGRIVTYFK